MCGIAGQLSPGGLSARDPNIYDGILHTMGRRGPDQEGIFQDGACVLMHRRLSVIDPEGGRQPMTIGHHTVVYNGELYNTEELRQELQAEGITFQTASDTEVLLQAYLRWGEDCPRRLLGIFAFAVYDRKNRRLFFARDHMGVKPLFYAMRNGSFYFGSELKSLLAFPEIEPVVDARGLYDLMFLGPGRTPGYGVFHNVFEVLPGHYGFYDEKGLRMTPYWVLEDGSFTDDFETCREKTRLLLEDSIHRQLVSDVPIGTFLSGGLDSSVVSAVAARQIPELNTFSVDYVDNDRHFHSTDFQPTSDSGYIGPMAEHIGARSHRFQLTTEELTDSLYAAVEARDLPGMADVDGSMLLLCKKAKEHATVILSGECADEIFGGYPWFRQPKIRAADGFPWAKNTDYRASFLRSELLEWENPKEFIQNRYDETLKQVHVLADTPEEEKRHKEMTCLNLKWFMQTLLDRKDRMSMYSGLEVRVPFCDKRIVEYLYRVPWEFKNYGGREKGLLREAFRDLLPEGIYTRKKSPYPKTWDPAYKAAVARLLREELSDRNSPLLDFLRPEALTALCDEERGIPWYGQLMTTPQTIAYFLQMSHWLRYNHVTLRY